MLTLSALAGRRSRDLCRVYRPMNTNSATTRQNPLFISSSSSSFFSRERDDTKTPTPTTKETETAKKVLLLYKGPNVKLFRAIVRFKLLQVFSIGAVSTPLLLVFGGGDGGIENVSATTQMLFASASAFGAIGCSFALQEFANRYVGELALLSSLSNSSSTTNNDDNNNNISNNSTSGDAEKKLRISSMDFWGNRIETVVKYPEAVEAPLRNVPESSYGEIAEATFLPLDVYLDEEKREKKQFMVSLRHGKLIDKKKLLDVLSGKN